MDTTGTEGAKGSGSEPTKIGDFDIEGRLGAGGMGVVYRARQVSLDRPVAIKVLPEALSSKPQFLERFKREAKAAANLAHPNILQVFAYGVDQGRAYIAMELVVGEDLAVRLRRERLPLEEAVRLTRDGALALAAAGDRSLVHRDIKPANMMLREDGALKIMDFGLAKATSGGDSGLTEAGLVVGTPKYMSPEQARGERLDTRSDLYSLGISFYEMLTGQAPFSADTTTALIYKHVFEQPQPPRAIEPNVPPFIEDVVLRMIQKRPDDRYANGHEVAADLDEFLRHQDDYVGTGKRRVAAAPKADAARGAGAGGRDGAGVPLVAVSSGPALALAVVALIVALGGVVYTALAPRGGATRVVVVPEDPVGPTGETVLAELTVDLPLPFGTRASWNAITGDGSGGGAGGAGAAGGPDQPAVTQFEPGKAYLVRPGRFTIVLDRAGYEPIILPVKFDGQTQPVLPDGTRLGAADLRFQPIPELVKAYELGRQCLERGDGANVDAAVRHLQKAAALDPRYRPGGEQQAPSAEELLEQATKKQDLELGLRRELRRSLGLAETLHASNRHRAALQALPKGELARRARREVTSLTRRCEAALAQAGALVEAARLHASKGELDPAAEGLRRLQALDPEHPERADLERFVADVSQARRVAMQDVSDSSDLAAAIARVEGYLARQGRFDEAMLRHLDALQARDRERKRRERDLASARARLRQVVQEQAWEQVLAVASRVVELDPGDAEARTQAEAAGERLREAAIRRAMAALDRACEDLSTTPDGVARVLQHVGPEHAASLERFRRAGRILSSDRRNVEVVARLPGGAARVRFDWSLELMIEALGRPIVVSIPMTAVARPRGDDWLLTSFASTEPR